MKTTDPTTAERLAALERRRGKGGGRRRPAEASRILAAGAGTAAVFTMVTAMSHADQVVAVVESPVFEMPGSAVPPTVEPAPVPQSPVRRVSPVQEPVIQTITVARPVRTQVSNARTSASR
ncbi:MAG: hypothetical protein OEQ47_04860 [Acidimicrobiia bacterium]|nr:hypothetical protein [Acidimicrobiia bacterium]